MRLPWGVASMRTRHAIIAEVDRRVPKAGPGRHGWVMSPGTGLGERSFQPFAPFEGVSQVLISWEISLFLSHLSHTAPTP